MREPGLIKRAPRVATRQPAVMLDSEGCETRVVVLNISKGGFRLAADEPLLIGEHVRLRLSRYGDFAAQIRWAFGNEGGGVFLEPVNIA